MTPLLLRSQLPACLYPILVKNLYFLTIYCFCFISLKFLRRFSIHNPLQSIDLCNVVLIEQTQLGTIENILLLVPLQITH